MLKAIFLYENGKMVSNFNLLPPWMQTGEKKFQSKMRKNRLFHIDIYWKHLIPKEKWGITETKTSVCSISFLFYFLRNYFFFYSLLITCATMHIFFLLKRVWYTFFSVFPLFKNTIFFVICRSAHHTQQYRSKQK